MYPEARAARTPYRRSRPQPRGDRDHVSRDASPSGRLGVEVELSRGVWRKRPSVPRRRLTSVIPGWRVAPAGGATDELHGAEQEQRPEDEQGGNGGERPGAPALGGV